MSVVVADLGPVDEGGRFVGRRYRVLGVTKIVRVKRNPADRTDAVTFVKIGGKTYRGAAKGWKIAPEGGGPERWSWVVEITYYHPETTIPRITDARFGSSAPLVGAPAALPTQGTVQVRGVPPEWSGRRIEWLDCTSALPSYYRSWDGMVERAKSLLWSHGVAFGKEAGKGAYAQAWFLRRPAGFVVKITGDPSEAAAWATVLASRRKIAGLARTTAVYALPEVLPPHEFTGDSDCHGLQPEPRRLFVIVQEALEPLPEDEYELIDGLSFLAFESVVHGWKFMGRDEDRWRRTQEEAVAIGAATAARLDVLVETARALQTLGIGWRDTSGGNVHVHPPTGGWRILDLGASVAPAAEIPVVAPRRTT